MAGNTIICILYHNHWVCEKADWQGRFTISADKLMLLGFVRKKSLQTQYRQKK